MVAGRVKCPETEEINCSDEKNYRRCFIGSDKTERLLPCVIIDNNSGLMDYDSQFILVHSFVPNQM